MVSQQVSTLAALALAGTSLICVLRLHFLKLVSKYPSVFLVLVLQILTTVASQATGLQTGAYPYLYVALLVLEWVVYGLMIREIYGFVFHRYPGLAVIGHWTVYIAITATAIVCALSFPIARQLLGGRGVVLYIIQYTANCLTFGFAFVILFILLAISWYPIGLHKNVAVNSIFFGIIVLAEAAGLLVEISTHRQITADLNLIVSGIVIACFILWPLALTLENTTFEEAVVIFRRVEAGAERRLMNQLEMLNSVMLRAIRSKL